MSRIPEERRDFWRRLVSEQEQSGLSVRAFCQQNRASEHSFYQWRKRLAAHLPVKFALVETNGARPAAEGNVLELVLVSGERLQIAPGFDAATLRAVLTVLRER